MSLTMAMAMRDQVYLEHAKMKMKISEPEERV